MLEQGQTKNITLGAILLPSLVGVCFIALVFRLWYLQIVRNEELTKLAVSARTISVAIPAPRGLIVDRYGIPIATVKPSLALMVTPGEIAKFPEKIKRLANTVGMDEQDLQSAIQENMFRKLLPFVAKAGLTPEQAVSVEEQRAFLPGAFVRTLSVREYPIGAPFAHVVGYVGGLSPADVERLTEAGRDLPNFVGKVGIERAYDLNLLGQPGTESVEVDRRGKQLNPRQSSSPTPGDRLVLSIDSNLQIEAERALGSRRGAVVAMDPKSGEILCLVSSPTYDPNLFARRISAADWKRLSGNSALPLLNRAVASAFAPGSTVKMATLIAAIRAGVVSPGTTFVCEGSTRIGNRTIDCLGNHGRINYETAIEKSCNVFFAQVASRLTREQLIEVFQEFGLGSQTGIDLLGERSGVLATDKFVENLKQKWYLGDTVNLGIGQGYFTTTPVQMAQYAACLANRGWAPKPHLVRIITTPGDNQAESVRPVQGNAKISVDSTWWDRIQNVMVSVVNSGTGARAQVSGFRVAGKTGSAEQRRGDKTHAWFIGFAPADEPKIAIAVLLEEAGHGGDEAAPIAGRVIETYLSSLAERLRTSQSEVR